MSRSQPLLPPAAPRNTSIQRYAAIVSEVARELGLLFVDLYWPTEKIYNAQRDLRFTYDGCHLTPAGDQAVAHILDCELFGNPPNVDSRTFEMVRAAVNDKSWVHLQDYRMLNGWYVNGGRRTKR